MNLIIDYFSALFSSNIYVVSSEHKHGILPKPTSCCDENNANHASYLVYSYTSDRQSRHTLGNLMLMPEQIPDNHHPSKRTVADHLRSSSSAVAHSRNGGGVRENPVPGGAVTYDTGSDVGLLGGGRTD